MSYNLDRVEVRVLAKKKKKEITTPDYYPLTLNSLVNSCNQKSNRDPVLTLDPSETMKTLDRLRDRHFAACVHPADSRVEKYEQCFVQALKLTIQETAVLCELVLRGPQTVGELRGRASRMYPFEDLDEIRAALDALVENEGGPLVQVLPKQPGRKERRYAHLLCGKALQEQEGFEGAKPMISEAASPEKERLLTLERQVQSLKAELVQLKEAFETFKAQFD